jgi:DNA-binding IclR family transcriptional regulator
MWTSTPTVARAARPNKTRALQVRKAASAARALGYRKALRAALELIRRDGYALDRGEISDDVRCVAVPVFDASGFTAGALSVSMPHSRFATKRERVRGHALATAIGAGLGAAQPPERQ